MTAINSLIMPDAIHLFADRGCYHVDTLELIEHRRKLLVMQHINAVVAFCGPPILGEEIHSEMMRIGNNHKSAFVEITNRVTSKLIIKRPFTSYFFQMTEQPFGIAIQEGMRISKLPIYSITKSISVDYSFDIRAIESSGLRMMEEQKKKSHVVSGACDYVKIDSNGVTFKILKVW